jgi:hypothetical protein
VGIEGDRRQGQVEVGHRARLRKVTVGCERNV